MSEYAGWSESKGPGQGISASLALQMELSRAYRTGAFPTHTDENLVEMYGDVAPVAKPAGRRLTLPASIRASTTGANANAATGTSTFQPEDDILAAFRDTQGSAQLRSMIPQRYKARAARAPPKPNPDFGVLIAASELFEEVRGGLFLPLLLLCVCIVA